MVLSGVKMKNILSGKRLDQTGCDSLYHLEEQENPFLLKNEIPFKVEFISHIDYGDGRSSCGAKRQEVRGLSARL